MIQSIKNSPFTLLFLVSFLILSIFSCTKDDQGSLLTSQAFTDASVDKLQNRAIGTNHCLEFIFPISIAFIDGSIVEVEDYDALKETVKQFFIDNNLEKSKENKPSLVFPIEVVNQDGAVIQVDSQEELKELRSECPKNGKGKKGKSCFSLVFPISVQLGDELVTFEDRSSMREAIKAFKENADEDTDRPMIVFPIEVEYEDGDTVEVSSGEELKALKEACKSA